MYSRLPHISVTPFLKGVANRLFMQQRPSVTILSEPTAFVKGRSERSALSPWSPGIVRQTQKIVHAGVIKPGQGD